MPTTWCPNMSNKGIFRPFEDQWWKRNDREEGDRRTGRRDKPRCEHCQKLGHSKDQCYKIIGYPPCWEKSSCEGNSREKVTSTAEQKSVPKAAQVGLDASLVPGLTQMQYDRLLQFLNQQKHYNREPISHPCCQHDWTYIRGT